MFDRDKGKDSASTIAALYSCEGAALHAGRPDPGPGGEGLNHGLAAGDWRGYKEPRGGAPEGWLGLMKAA